MPSNLCRNYTFTIYIGAVGKYNTQTISEAKTNLIYFSSRNVRYFRTDSKICRNCKVSKFMFWGLEMFIRSNKAECKAAINFASVQRKINYASRLFLASQAYFNIRSAKNVTKTINYDKNIQKHNGLLS